MKPVWKRIALLAVCLTLIACLLSAIAETAFQGRTDAASAHEQWAGRRKSTPTPKPKKTPKPAVTAAPGDPGTPTPAPTETVSDSKTTPVPEGPIIDPQSITDWLFAHDFTLPDNFITKKEAQALGWDSRRNYVSDVAPGKSIGGDYFGNYEGKLPTAKGRRYYECDCYYVRGKRSAYRLIFSDDGLVFYTEDHYNTFVQMYPSDANPSQAP